MDSVDTMQSLLNSDHLTVHHQLTWW